MILFQTRELKTAIREIIKLYASLRKSLCSQAVLGCTAKLPTECQQTFWQGGDMKEKQITSKFNKQSKRKQLNFSEQGKGVKNILDLVI